MEQLSFFVAGAGVESATFIAPHKHEPACRTAPTAYVRARRTDPATSHKAAERAAEFAGSHVERITRALVARGGRGTAKDISALSGLSVVQVDRRRHEMVKAGTVRLARDEAGELVECDGFDVWEAC